MASWWDDAVVYEVYPRSFADTDGDGVGDLSGVAERLPYLRSLGVDGIWLTPFQRSPQADQGYDISDYCDVDPLFGSLDDFDRLVADAHAVGIRVIIDIVPNHASTEHPLFRRAVAAGPGSAERELFHFVAAGQGRPNNWVSVFGGGAWARDPEQAADDPEWYLHLFSDAQPDWNWRSPAVHDLFDAVLRFWFDRGADGIRIDVAHGLYKAPGLPDTETVPTVIDGLRTNPLAMDQEEVHEVYRRWRRIADGYRPGRLLVGEVNLQPERAGRYTRPDELHQSFAFAFATLGWEPAAWVAAGESLEEARRSYGATTTWALENHDLVRTATRFGPERARAALLALLGLPGSVYVYQGQELGLPEADVPPHRGADPMRLLGGISRDGARVPLPWTRAADGAYGFSTREEVEPWLPVPTGWGERSVQAQEEDDDSTLALFRRAVRMRRRLAGATGAPVDIGWRQHPGGLVECARSDDLSVFIAMAGAVPLPEGRILISSAPLGPGGVLPADASCWWAPVGHPVLG